ncbi:unnamed protein product [Gadus morhua 'NCC']
MLKAVTLLSDIQERGESNEDATGEETEQTGEDVEKAGEDDPFLTLRCCLSEMTCETFYFNQEFARLYVTWPTLL